MDLQPHRQLFCHDARFGHWFVPGLRARVPHERGGYFVTTNRDGARCRELTPKPAGPRRVQRVLVLGDSFSAADGVDNAERYSDRLEALLDGVEVFNLALPGSGTDQQVLIQEAYEPRVQPDILVFAPLVENIRRIVAHYREGLDPRSGAPVLLPKPYFTLAGDALVPHHLPAPRPLRRDRAPADAAVDQGGRFAGLRAFINTRAPALKPLAFRLSRYQPHPEYDRADHPAWLLMRALLTRAFTRTTATLKVLMPLPYYVHIEGLTSPNYLTPFRALAGELGVTFVDVLPRLRALPADLRRACRYPRDIHYTPLAHGLVADALASALLALGAVKRQGV